MTVKDIKGRVLRVKEYEPATRHSLGFISYYVGNPKLKENSCWGGGSVDIDTLNKHYLQVERLEFSEKVLPKNQRLLKILMGIK